MEKIARHNRFILLHLAAIIAIGSHGGISVGQAQTVDVARARIETASLVQPRSPSRACWARYSAHGAEPRNGQIEETAFRVPCPETVTNGFIASLQRALQARDYYNGPITGQPDTETRDAVRAFQRATGFDSPILTLETAQRLGLSPRDFSRN